MRNYLLLDLDCYKVVTGKMGRLFDLVEFSLNGENAIVIGK